MVFEALVSDLLNRFIGDYVENLDKSQLKIGIWGGNVVLQNLKVKENALSEFDLPLRVKAGQIGTLTLKIPWKNLYNDAVVATLDGLYLLVVPGATGAFDADKEERYRQEAKQRELQRIEEALQRDSPAEEKKKDSFAEKLATQVIKNLQVEIRNIHLRYEDDLTDRLKPVSMGITLSEISLQTTDENWKLCILNEAAKIIYKLGRLDGLCVYWNVNSPVFYRDSWEDILAKLQAGITSQNQDLDLVLPHYHYIFKPIFASSKMFLNPNAESDLKSPKVKVHLEVQNIDIEMTRPQFVSMMEVLESLDQRVKNAPYRKFRPDVPVHQHCRLWWRYAYSSILEVQVRRSRLMWSWSNIRQHRLNLKAYKTAYKTKLQNQTKTAPETDKQVQDLEKILDVFSITLVRQQAKMEVVRSGQRLSRGRGGGGGFFSWFGRKAKKEEQSQEEQSSGLDQLMTAEEKAKLYTAIGYSGSSHSLTLPRKYVAVVISFQLFRTSVTIREQVHVPEILKVQVLDLQAKISQRPGAQAVRLEVALQHWLVTGLEQRGVVPSLVASVEDSSSSLLDVVFELNPEDGAGDQLLQVQSQPVQIIYDALTLSSLVEFFQTGRQMDLEVLTSATLSKLEEIKEKTAAGLSRIIETRKVLDLRIDLKPSYFLLPKTGFYSPDSDLLILDFGSFQLNSVQQSSVSSSHSSFSSLEEIIDRAYDRYSVELRRVQVLFSRSGEAWKEARLQGSSVQHILQPLDLKVQLAKSLVDRDARMPRFKVSGQLPLLHVRISNQKVQDLLELIDSVPRPSLDSSPPSPSQKVLPLAEVRPRPLGLHAALLDAAETDSEDDTSEKSSDEEQQRAALEDLVEVSFHFEAHEILLELCQQDKQDQQDQLVLSLSVGQLGAEGRKRTFDLSVTSYLRRVSLDFCNASGKATRLHLIRSSEQQDSNLLKVELIKADPSGPSFQTVFDQTEQMLRVNFSSLDFILDTTALLSTISFLSNIVPSHRKDKSGPDQKKMVERNRSNQTVSRRRTDDLVFSFKLLAVLDSFNVLVRDADRSIAKIQVQGIDASLSIQPLQTEVSARLRDITVTDVGMATIHRKVVSIEGEEVFSFRLRLFPGATEGGAYSDVSNVDGELTLRLGCIRIVYLHKFLLSLLTFVGNFQAAKEALSVATATAAEKAASSVRDLAQKSFRLSLDIKLKAPLIVVPQSSNSHNALLLDLGLITVRNHFSLLPAGDRPLPAVIDNMDIQLTQLQVSRTALTAEPTALDLQILRPINLELQVTRNLAVSWLTAVPAVQVQGVLRSLQVSLSEENLSVVMKILQENIGDGPTERRANPEPLADPEHHWKPVEATSTDGSNATERQPEDNTVSVVLDFEVKEVAVCLKKLQSPLLLLLVSQLGVKTKVRKFDLCATAYIRKICLTSPQFPDSSGEPLCLISSSVESEPELLKVQYCKADPSGPHFSSVYKNTEQMITVTFTSLDLTLHTESLLAALSFLSAVMSSKDTTNQGTVGRGASDKTTSAKTQSLVLLADDDVIGLKVLVTLGSFNILLCDQTCSIAHINVRDLNGSLLNQGPQTHISARLQDFAIVNLDPQSVHQKAVSIVEDEVFSFTVSLTPTDTVGSGYSDTERTDGTVRLNVGCVRVVYLHRFTRAVLKFSNNFQAAKEALSVATATAAEKAASSVRDLAQKSFRLSLDIRLKAPLIVVPQSSNSHNALLLDLGLITVRNHFSLLPAGDRPLPAVIDNMDIQLTQLQVSRTSVDPVSGVASGSGGGNTSLLEPVNLHLNLRRNLAASWYKDMAAVELNGDLKPMKLELSQDDLTVLLRILTENLGEAENSESRSHPPESRSHPPESRSHPPESGAPPTGVIGKPMPEDEGESIKFNLNIESLGLILYQDKQHHQDRRLGELLLHLLKVSGKLLNNGSMEAKAVLTSCSLDDLRTGMKRATSRMLACRQQRHTDPMVEVSFLQNTSERQLVAILQNFSLCASVEFLQAVAHFFLQALPQTPATATSDRRLQVRTPAHQPATLENASSAPKSRVQVVLLDPEVVFVASLMEADAPALVASFQCDLVLRVDNGGQNLRANLRDLKLQARQLVPDPERPGATTVLKPCSVVLDVSRTADSPLTASVIVEEVIVKISPFIINTVMTVSAAMKVNQTKEEPEESSPNVSDLWSVMNIYACNFWFLGVDQAAEVTENFQDPDRRRHGDTVSVDVKVLQVTLESGLGHRTVPLLLAESSFSSSARNLWSDLQIHALLTLEVNYFNQDHAVWEPLLERVDGGRRRWGLELQMKTNEAEDSGPLHGVDLVLVPEARSVFTACSRDTLDITLSQSSLNVFRSLAEAFSEGTASTFNPPLKEPAPFTVKNCLGVPLLLQLGATLRPVGGSSPGKLQELQVDQTMELEHSLLQSSSRGRLSALQCQDSSLFSLSIVPSGFSEMSNVSLETPGRRLVNIRGPMLQDSVSVLLQVDVADGNKILTVRSPLQVKNHFLVPFEVLEYHPASGGLQTVGLAQPGADFHVGLETYRSQLFLRPAGGLAGRYSASSSCVSWKEQVHRSTEVRSLLQCPPADDGEGPLPLCIAVTAVPDVLNHIASHGEDDWDPAYILHLHPVASLRNLLPYAVRYMMESCADSYELQEGGTSDLLNARVSGEIVSLVLLQYQGRDWHGHLRLQADLPEFLALQLTCDSEFDLTVDVSVHVLRTGERLRLSLFSPYWIINQTGRVLQYRADDLTLKHPADLRHLTLFSFRKRNLFSKNTVQLCVSNSSWSPSFSLDTVGSFGCVRCPGNNMDFLVGVSIQISSFNLTRIVTMSPFYTLNNRSSYELEVGEELQPGGTSRWHYVPANECLPLWPDSGCEKLCVRVVGAESASRSFFFNRQDNGTLLRMELCGGLLVDVNVSNHSSIISFSNYYDGAAPALLVNHTTWTTVCYCQSGSSVLQELRPGEARRFVFDDPIGRRCLTWTFQGQSGDLDLLKDALGEFKGHGGTGIQWVSFLDGRQRVVLFTEDVAVVTKARQAEDLEPVQQELRLSLQNVGLSLVNNRNRQEVAYVGVSSSGVVWELRPKTRWKPFSQKNINLLEANFQKQQGLKSDSGWVKLDGNLEVNFGSMMLRQPVAAPVRRNFLPGIQVEFKESLHQRSVRAQLYWLQVDNQLPAAVFPTVFHPVLPPKSVVLDSEPRPFVDVSIITRFNQHSNITQFKYFMALVQEMSVKLDQGFLGSVLALFTPAVDRQADGQKSGLIDGDLRRLQTELTEASLSDSSAGLSFFQHFHISPIKLHLSLSLGSGGDDVLEEVEAVQALHLLLRSIGATLTDVDDLIFKLAFFQVKFQFYRKETLVRAVGRHYTEQFLKQLYVLVLGLDVLGNPFGLIRGLSEGVEAFFYEPFQGAVQGPEEFAEGFVIGVRSLLGHTVGGAAGVVSRITGSMGKGLAAITMDKEFQQKRREEMNRPSRDFGHSLAKGGKGLLKGVVGGVTGIVTKPVEGARKEGAAGFFKGVGKGLVGVVARPTGGIVDMASSTFQGIQRAAESTEEVSRLRPVRLIGEDGIIRPYDPVQAQGFDLFQRSQIKQLDGETFRHHCPYPGHRKTNIIVTNRRVFCVKEIDFVGHFNKEWECLFDNFYRPPSTSGPELKIYCKETNKLLLPKKGSEEPVRSVKLGDAQTAQMMQAAIFDAQMSQQQHQMFRQKSQRFLKP